MNLYPNGWSIVTKSIFKSTAKNFNEEIFNELSERTLAVKYYIIHNRAFPVMHKVGNVGIFVSLKFGNRRQLLLSNICYFDSKYHVKWRFVSKYPTSNYYQFIFICWSCTKMPTSATLYNSIEKTRAALSVLLSVKFREIPLICIIRMIAGYEQWEAPSLLDNFIVQPCSNVEFFGNTLFWQICQNR